MENYIAVVSHADNKITKYQDFALEADANAHVSAHGGFVCAKPNGILNYWVVDADKKTLTYDKSTHDSDVAAAAAVAYKAARAEVYPDIRDFADAYYWAQKGDDSKMTAYISACAKVKADLPKPE